MRAVDFGLETGATRRPGVPSPFHGRSVYSGRTLRPLREAVEEAIGLPDTAGVDAEDLDWSALWSRPELAGRLVQAFADHAVGCRAGRILAPSPADRDLAAAVAARLGLPLEGARPGGGDPPDPGHGRRGFLVARMLHDRETAGSGSGEGPGPVLVGGATVLGTGDDGSPRRTIYNIVSVTDLSRST